MENYKNTLNGPVGGKSLVGPHKAEGCGGEIDGNPQEGCGGEINEKKFRIII